MKIGKGICSFVYSLNAKKNYRPQKEYILWKQKIPILVVTWIDSLLIWDLTISSTTC